MAHRLVECVFELRDAVSTTCLQQSKRLRYMMKCCKQQKCKSIRESLVDLIDRRGNSFYGMEGDLDPN